MNSLQELFWCAAYVLGIFVCIVLSGFCIRILINIYTQTYGYVYDWRAIKKAVKANADAPMIIPPPAPVVGPNEQANHPSNVFTFERE